MKLIVVSNRLPVMVTSGPDGPVVKPGDGGLATAMGRAARRLKPRWVGSLGASASPNEVRAMTDKNFFPVDIDAASYKRYYSGYSNRVLWPVLHGFDSILKPSTYWSDYVATNSRFADYVACLVEADDIIWIHDYHLFLLPEILRNRGLANKIGFFLHTPFSDAPFFKDSPQGRRIVRSLALCDSVGVQTSRNLSNLKAVARTIAAGTFPIGIDFPQFARKPDPSPVFLERLPSHRRIKTVMSLSRLDYTKGLPQLISAAELVGKKFGSSAKFKLRLVVIPSREQQREYQYLRERLEKAVSRANSGSPDDAPLIDYYYGFLSPEQCMEAYRMADVFVAAPLADGMNLVSKEYVAANPSGTLVLGKDAGAAEQLSDSILVDAKSPHSIAEGIAHALTHPAIPAVRRRIRRIVRRHDVHRWAKSFLATLQT